MKRVKDTIHFTTLSCFRTENQDGRMTFHSNPVGSNGKPLTMSLREYESFVLHGRTASNSLILRGGRLTQQYCVGQWAKCEQERLRFIEKIKQFQYRLETLQGLTDALRNESVDVHSVAANEEVAQRGSKAATRQSRDAGVDSTEPEAENVGRKVVIPPTFTRGPRYIYQCFLDAMAIVRVTGAPNLFITMTCNPNWPEIKENLRPREKASDRPDIVAHVFMQKLKTLNKNLDEGLVGKYQKRGLLHAHILLVMRPEDKPVTAEDVDRLTSAELLDKETHPALYQTVISNMLHGLCGQQNPNCPCVKNGKCSNKFPKQFAEGTIMVEESILRTGDVDNAKINQWVVPYNPFLSQKYDCRINVEVCATNKAVKYIYKYVYKGSDMMTITIEGEEIQANDILQYLLGRYISPVEACMRLFGFPTQGSSHAVVNLPIQLEGMSLITYRDHATTPQLQNLVLRGDRTKLTAVFNLCMQDPEGTADLLYKDVPVKYRWDDRLKHWVPYRRYVAALGRLAHVSPQDPERVLLFHRLSPKSFEDIRTVNGVVYNTFYDTALAAGYLENDQEWEECLAEAVLFKMSSALRQLWESFWFIRYPIMLQLSGIGLRRICQKTFSDPSRKETHKITLTVTRKVKVPDVVGGLSNFERKTLSMYGLPDLETYSDVSDEVAHQSADPMDIVAQEVAAYEPDDLERTATLADQMNENQKTIFDQVIEAVNHSVGGQKLFFVDGPGGTDTCSYASTEKGGDSSGFQRNRSDVVDWRTHGAFYVSDPLKLTCSLSWQSQKAERIRKASLIIWDEAPMMHRARFEAVDRSFRNIMKNKLEPFGGKVMVFSGDHRQILSVLKDTTQDETLEACFKSSPLWSHLRQVRLTENMRVQTAPDPASAAELTEFPDFLLQIGEGRYPVNSDFSENDICLPRDMCVVPGARADGRWNDEETKENENMEAPPNFNLLPPTEAPSDRGVDDPDEDRRKRNVNVLIDAVYPGVGDDNLLDEYFVERAILAPTNASVRRINDKVAECLSGETKEYLSVDSLEVGTPIIMIRNLNSDAELRNGTRLRVVSLRERSIEAAIMSGPFKGKRVFIPHIIFYNEDDCKEFPFGACGSVFRDDDQQGPGQSIHHVGIYLESPVFAHGQLYVALSRVTSRKEIKIAVDPEAIGEDGNIHTKNIVYREIFDF
ncbi:LOW QUALITY PROTEIN: Helitron helicase-like protein [Phytophthora palmivora]|uniref:ATP-dependent DNA helicase n=1 Tax=Phytophthora palmivora TaxID=4796 RepID=A0A2P4YNH7_9STRA|nr:LOW QUALITY PROTEIN: Helitron helicase-like protein [Phytophthora palmivora]